MIMGPRIDAETMQAELRGRIFSALLGEATWDDFLAGLRSVLPNGAATLFHHDTSIGAGAFSLASGLSEEARTAYATRYSKLNPWMQAATRRPVGLPVPDSAMFDRQTLLRTEFYNDYLVPNKLRGAVGITIDQRDSYSFFLSVLGDTPDTAERRDAMYLIRALVPDLRRAFAFYRRNRPILPSNFAAPTAAEDLSGLLVLGPGRRLHAATGLAETELERGGTISMGPTGKVNFRDRRVARHIDTALSLACIWCAPSAPRVFLSPSPPSLPIKMTVIPSPWAREMRYFRGPECLILLQASEGCSNDLAEVAYNYAFTPAELRVANGLVAGLSLQEIAADGGVALDTVRSHLRALFAKTETHRQPDLVRLLLTLAS